MVLGVVLDLRAEGHPYSVRRGDGHDLKRVSMRLARGKFARVGRALLPAPRGTAVVLQAKPLSAAASVRLPGGFAEGLRELCRRRLPLSESGTGPYTRAMGRTPPYQPVEWVGLLQQVGCGGGGALC